MDRPFGSMPPSDRAWQLGKTAGVIRMVGILEARKPTADAQVAAQIQELIDALKAGTKTLEEVASQFNIGS